MNKVSISATCFLVCMAFAWCLCTRDPAGLCGTSNETQTVSGKVTDSTGSPVVNAFIILHKQAADGTSGNFSRKAVTDGSGHFRFDSVDTGKYFIESMSGDSLQGELLDTVIRSGSKSQTINPALNPVGTIKGAIDSGLLAGNASTFVYTAEIGRRAQINSTGLFEFGHLPKFNYHLHVCTDTGKLASPLDTVKLSVRCGDTTYSGNLLPIINLSVRPDSGAVPCSVVVACRVIDQSGTTTTTVLNYGDENADTTQMTQINQYHTYTRPGKYLVMVWVRNARGGYGEDSAKVIVTPAITTP